ncbi:hypothetical protein ACROYT_G019027 [Oculina patagonica]
MPRKLAAVATLLVFSLSLVVQNSAYVTLIERQLKLCRSNSNDDDSRVRRWGWWGTQKPSERQCSSYRTILCKSQIAPGLESKVPVPTVPPSLPSLPPLPPSLPPPGALPKRKRRSSSTVRKDFETVNNIVKK